MSSASDLTRRIQRDYDALHFPCEPLSQGHPDHLATLAHLMGLEAPEVTSARVLELGCGTGENLLSLAQILPEARFVGVDLSAAQIERAEATRAALGFEHVSFHAADIADFEVDAGAFDYICCHGVYSWVPEPVRDRILQLTARGLAPDGVALISFNSLPGWHISGLMRDIFFEVLDRSQPPEAQIARAREVLTWVIASEAVPDNICAPSLGALARELHGADDRYLFHEYLAPVNQPFYLRDFLVDAAEHGLRYLANAIPVSMLPANFPPAIQAGLRDARDATQLQHLLDIAQGKRFQNCLLVHDRQAPSLAITPDRIEGLRVFADLLSDPALDPDDPFEIHTRHGGIHAALSGEHLRAAFSRLTRAAPRAVSFDELARDVDADTRADLATHLLRLYFSLAVGLGLHPAPITDAAGSHPRTSALIRHQAARQPWVSSLWHRAQPVTETERALLTRLDGATSREALLDSPAAAAALERFARWGLLEA